MSARQSMVDVCSSYVGCNAGPDDRDRFLSLVAPDESDATKAAMTTAIFPSGMPGMSSCALVIRGYLRILGLKHKRLDEPYRNSMAVADLYEIALDHHALVSAPLRERRPELGDIVCVGGGTDGGGAEHVYVVTAFDGEALLSVDGGQRIGNPRPSERWQLIESKTRTWQQTAQGTIWDQARGASDPGGGARRKVRWFVDLAKLPIPEPHEPPCVLT